MHQIIRKYDGKKKLCDYIEKGLKEVSKDWEIVKVPMADGGEGTLEALIDATNGKILKEKTVGPLGEEVNSRFGILGKKNIAVIEMASTSGFRTNKPRKNPYLTTTYGTGQLILKALDQNVEKIILGIGVEVQLMMAGVGMLQALGANFLDKNGNQIAYEWLWTF